MLLAILLEAGSSEGEIEGILSIVLDILINIQNIFFVKLQELVATLTVAAMKQFGPNMSTFLTIFGYDPDKYAIQSWASPTDSTISNLFAIFAVIGYILAIVILIISLLKCAMANVMEAHDTPLVLMIRFVITFIMITYSNSLIKFVLDINQAIFDKIYDSTSANINDSLTLSLDSSSKSTQISGIGTIKLSALGILGVIFAIIIAYEFIKMVVEMIAKYLIIGVMYIVFPTVASTFVSKDTENIFRAYFRMLISSLLLLMLNVWVVGMYITLLENIGNTSMSPLTQCITVVAFEKFAQKLDNYMNSLGLNNAVTGGMLMDQIIMAGQEVLAAPGRVESSINGSVELANVVPKAEMNRALANGDYIKAAKAADHVHTPLARMKAKQRVRDSLANANLTVDQIAGLGIDNAILNSGGTAFTASTVANAVAAAGGKDILDALKQHTGKDASLDGQAKWDKRDNAWHMNASTEDGNIGLKIKSKGALSPDEKGFMTFKDSAGKEWAVMLDKPDLKNTANQDAVHKAMDEAGNIKDAWMAEKLTGIHTDHGIKVNPDNTYSVLDANGDVTGERYVPDGKGGFFTAQDDSYVANSIDPDGNLGVHMEKMRQDSAGGYTATMTVSGLYGEDDNTKATFDVRFGSADTQQANEVEFASFTNPTTGEETSVFMSDEAVGTLMQQSAGKDIENANIAGAMMGMSEEDMQSFAQSRDTADIMGDTYHVSANGTTISRMDSAYENGYGGEAVVSTKYSTNGEQLFSYASGEGPVNDAIFTNANAFNTEFGSQLDSGEQASAVERSAGKNGYDDMIVTTEDGQQHKYVNANNLNENAKISRNTQTLHDNNGNTWVERRCN